MATFSLCSRSHQQAAATTASAATAATKHFSGRRKMVCRHPAIGWPYSVQVCGGYVRVGAYALETCKQQSALKEPASRTVAKRSVCAVWQKMGRVLPLRGPTTVHQYRPYMWLGVADLSTSQLQTAFLHDAQSWDPADLAYKNQPASCKGEFVRSDSSTQC